LKVVVTLVDHPNITWKYYPNEHDVHDDHGHGTAVALTIADFVQGWDGDVTIVIIKVSYNDGGRHIIDIYDALQGLFYVNKENCNLVNISWGFPQKPYIRDDYNMLMEELVKAERKGIQFFMASGNCKGDVIDEPLLPAHWANTSLTKSYCVSQLDYSLTTVVSSYCPGNRDRCIRAPGAIKINNIRWNGTSQATSVATGAYLLTGCRLPVLM